MDGADAFGEDFGQRIDLCVRIREIIRAYPEGTAVLKELVSSALILRGPHRPLNEPVQAREDWTTHTG